MASEPAAQHRRRERILQATIELASQGGFEAVQMRSVADRADVAIGTLYRYFPSKMHLLLAVMVGELERVTLVLADIVPPGATPAIRVNNLIEERIQAQQEEPRLHAALIRAYVFFGESSPQESARVSDLTRALVCRTISATAPATERDDEVASVLGDVWLSASIGRVAGRLTNDDMRTKLALAIRLLLGD